MGYEEIEVLGASVTSMLAGFGEQRGLAERLLTQAGITPLDPQRWYPLPSWLAAMKAVEAQVGRHVLHQSGQAVLSHAKIPIDLRTLPGIHEGMRYVDVGYHLNHRKAGRVMFDPASNRMEEGIGHYGAELVPGQNKVRCVVDAPYPCDFDRGIVGAMARLFKPTALTTHAPGPCRKQGAPACTYEVTWL